MVLGSFSLLLEDSFFLLFDLSLCFLSSLLKLLLAVAGRSCRKGLEGAPSSSSLLRIDFSILRATICSWFNANVERACKENVHE